MESTEKSLRLSVDKECPVPLEATIKGEVPGWLSGDLFRVGPGNFNVGTGELKHWFDGFSLLHKFRIEEGSVTYQSKFLQSDHYLISKMENRVALMQFGTSTYPDPCKNIFQKVMTWFQHPLFTDNCNINFIDSGDKLMVHTETPLVYEVCKDSLDTGKKFNLMNYAAVNTTTAHPHYDNDGNIINFGYLFKKKSLYGFFKMPPAKKDSENHTEACNKATMICHIPSTGVHPSYVHSFGMTANYIIMVEQPLFVNSLKLRLANLTKIPFGESLYFDKNSRTKFIVVKRGNGELMERTFIAGPLFVFHHINAYEDDAHIVLDLCMYPDDDVIKRLYLKTLRDANAQPMKDCKAVRFVLPLTVDLLPKDDLKTNVNRLPYSSATAVQLKDGTIFCTAEVLQENIDLELPAINYEQHNTRKYNFIYGVSGFMTAHHKLVKLNLKERKFRSWCEPGCYPSEPVFVARPGSIDEDDGVILSSIVKGNEASSSFLLVLDAKSFIEVARADIAHPSPMSLHGLFKK